MSPELSKVLGRLKHNNRPDQYGNYKCICPAHDDNDPSLSVKDGEKQVVFKCFSGCEEEDILNAINLNRKDIVYKNDNFIEDNYSVKIKEEDKPKKYYDTDRLEKRYKYLDKQGNEVYSKERYIGKGFGFSHLINNERYKGKGNNQSILYNLPNLIKGIKKNENIIMVEGEKDADNLIKLGYIATTKDNSSSNFKDTEKDNLKNANLIIFYDNDETGKKLLEKYKTQLCNTVKSMKVVHLESNKVGYDISDYIKDNNIKDRKLIDQLIDNAEVVNLEKEQKKEPLSLGNLEGNTWIKEQNNCYFKNDNKLLSTFIISLLEIIINSDDGEVEYKAIFKSQEHEEEIIFNANDFNNKNKFMELLKHPSFIFKGSQNDLQDIKYIVSKQKYKKTKGLSSVGLYEKNNNVIFLSQDQGIDKNNDEVNDYRVIENSKSIKTDILNQELITKEELRFISPFLFNFNDLKITSSILTLIPIMMMKPLLFKRDIKTQHLVIYGESGAGKSKTVENIIIPIFNSYYEDKLSCGNLTQFTLLKHLSSTNNIPVILDEYKPSTFNQSRINLISDTLRNVYDCHTATRGTAQQKVNRYNLVAPVIILGEEGQEETAIKERSIVLNLSKQSRNEGDREECFNILSSHKHLLNKLGRTILNNIMNINYDEAVQNRANKIKNLTDPKITESRVKESIGNMLLGLDVLIDVYSNLNLDFEKETGYEVKEIITAINENQYIEVLDENTNTRSIIDNTIQIFNQMAGLGELWENIDYTTINNNSELALNINNIYPKFTKYIREYDIKDEIIANQKQFVKMLRKTNYFIDYKSASFNGKVRKGYVLDRNKLNLLKIDTEDMKIKKK